MTDHVFVFDPVRLQKDDNEVIQVRALLGTAAYLKDENFDIHKRIIQLPDNILGGRRVEADVYFAKRSGNASFAVVSIVGEHWKNETTRP